MCASKGKIIFSAIVIAFLAAGGLYTLNEKMESPVIGGKAVNDTVVAVVGGEKVYLSEVMDFYKSNPQLKNVPLEMVYKDILNNMIDFKAVSVVAKKAGIEESADFIKGMKDAREQIPRAVYIKAEMDKKATDQAIKKLYDEYVKSNPPEEEIEASHILVNSEAKAKEVIRKLNKGDDFAKLAAEYSSDGTSKTGGNLGYFKKAAMVPEFANAAFAMKVGAYSQKPIKTMFGYHVIKVTDRRMSAPVPLDQIKDMLKMRISEQAFPEIIAAAKKDAVVNIKPAAYKNKYINLMEEDKKSAVKEEAKDVKNLPAKAEKAVPEANKATAKPDVEVNDVNEDSEEEFEEVEVEEDDSEPSDTKAPVAPAPKAAKGK